MTKEHQQNPREENEEASSVVLEEEGFEGELLPVEVLDYLDDLSGDDTSGNVVDAEGYVVDISESDGSDSAEQAVQTEYIWIIALDAGFRRLRQQTL